MPTPIDPKRLPRLKAALKRFKPGETVPQKTLADIYGVTNARWTGLAHTRFEGLPEPERHGDKTHWYEARPVIEAMIRYCEGQTASKRAVAARTAEILGEAEAEAQEVAAAPPKPEERAWTPAEIDKLASAQTRVFRLLQEKRMFVRADHHQHVVRRIFTVVQRSISAFPAEADPNGELPTMIRGRLDQASRDALKRLYDEIAEVLSDTDLLKDDALAA